MGNPQPFTILAVDDNLLNLKLIEKSLTKEGYRILTAIGGRDGRALASKEKPDLILLDIQMPGEDGFEVIKQLKKDSTTETIPVIFITGVSDVHAKLKGFELGAVDYITKPFHPLEVLARVRLHLKLSIATNSLIAGQARKLRQVTEAQTSMLPTSDDMPEACFGVYYRALEEAGGDFYDILRISENITGYFLADFSGHDIKTSYMTSSVKALLAQNCTPVYAPYESMKLVNDVLVEILPEGKYLTACYLHMNRSTGRLTIINSGHPPVVYLPCGGDPFLVKIDGDILGMFKDAHFGIQRIDTHKGDRFFLYSDGLVESSAKKINWVEGAQGLLPVFGRVDGIPFREAPAEVMGHLFNKEDPQEDDITLICVEV